MELNKISLKKAAKGYLEQWAAHDVRYNKYISSSKYSINERVDFLRECLCFYSIQRNVQPQKDELKNYDGYCGCDYNPEKHRVMLEVLDEFSPAGNWVEDVYSLESNLRMALDNKQNMLSLSSKILWQKVRGTYLVYDNDARSSLGIKSGDLLGFYSKWTKLYLANKNLIAESLEQCLDNSPFLPHRYDEFRQDWFYRRILDVYLVTDGRNMKI